MTLIVVDDAGSVRGTVTDGDIRRGLIAGHDTSAPVELIMNTRFTALHPAQGPKEIAAARERGMKLLPEVDADGRLVSVIDFSRQHTRLPLQAVLMAGGKGERLRPMTLTTPKPLLKIGGRPIIEYNIANLARAGVTDVTVTTRYMADKIKAHFSEPCCGLNVKTIEEDRPLGTLGAVSLVPHKPGAHTLVMNSDLLTDLSLEEMYLSHIERGADVTVAAIPYTVSVPYAIMVTGPDNTVKHLEEKPTYSYFANAGIYIFSNDLLDTLTPGEAIDAPDLVERAIAEGRKVTYHPIAGTWIDIGTPADFSHAEELMKFHR